MSVKTSVKSLGAITLLALLVLLLSVPSIQAQEETEESPADDVAEAEELAPEAEPLDSDTCLGCHSDPDIEAATERGKSLKLHVPENVLTGSVHEDMDCTDCHGGAKAWDEIPHNGGKPLSYKCADCHQTAVDNYNTTDIHGRRRNAGDMDAPWCNDCHGGHTIKPIKSQESVMSRTRQAELCGKCHSSEGLDTRKHTGISKRLLLERYKSSIHWKFIQEGSPAATCTDCHGHHTILTSSDPDSSVARFNLHKTCGKCHPNESVTFVGGSHGRAMMNGNLDVPGCVSCHGDHEIMSLKVQASGKRDFAATEICIWCHGNERMMNRYALDTSPVQHYLEDFHGQSQRGSLGTSATCADCHDAHHSLPESHPESRMHVSNRGTTCGKCHGQSSDTFIMSFSHKVVTKDPRGTIPRLIAIVYIILIIAIIGGMLVHNLIIWLYYARLKTVYQRRNTALKRMTRFELRWHMLLFISFAGLIFSGFALSFSDSAAFNWLYAIGMTEDIRAWMHRFFAVILMLDMLLLLIYKLFHKRGRKWWRWMFPRVQDVRDFINTMRFYMGFTREKPRYPVFSYAEKAEYWALIWGVLIMAITGILLWFTELIPPNSPPWVINAASTIHFYEAVLAGLAILVWHLFHTVFHPEEYPFSPTWLTGGMTEHEMEEKFTGEAIQEQQQDPVEDEIEDEQIPGWMKRGRKKKPPKTDKSD